ncbi:MAG: histidine kinase dimerization/phosphoacceptor domain -containing protein [Saprospiraceae bacterium]
MQEIHHRVKNNLQLISSLLSLQSRVVDDKKAADALLQSQSRVISIIR